MSNLKEDQNYPFYYAFNFEHENNFIKVFFDKENLNLIGWETKDIYQNLVQTFISDVKINIIWNLFFFWIKIKNRSRWYNWTYFRVILRE